MDRDSSVGTTKNSADAGTIMEVVVVREVVEVAAPVVVATITTVEENLATAGED